MTKLHSLKPVLVLLLFLLKINQTYQLESIQINIETELRFNDNDIRKNLTSFNEFKLYFNENDELSITTNIELNKYKDTSLLNILGDYQLRNFISKLCKTFLQQQKTNTQISLNASSEQSICYSNLKKLDLSSLNLIEFPNNLTQTFFQNLTHLILSNNLINSINDLKFLSHNLEFLDLSFNKIKTINLNAFQNLKNLKYLNLKANEINDINLFAFEVNINLIELNLKFNQLNDTSIQFLLFSDLNKLKYLDLSYNQLTRFYSYFTQNTLNLESLVLSNNKLKSIDCIIFRYLKNLDLSFNSELKLIRNANLSNGKLGLNRTKNLEYLSLAGLDFSDSSSQIELVALLKDLKQNLNLKFLNLSNCNVKSLIENFLFNFNRIEIIDLSNNGLNRLDCFQHENSSLSFINLNSNSIEDLTKILTCLNLSAKVDLRFNKLKSVEPMQFIDATVKKNNTSSILLEGNPLVCDCDLNSWWASLSDRLLFKYKNILFKIFDHENISCSILTNSYFSNLTSSVNDYKKDLSSFQFKQVSFKNQLLLKNENTITSSLVCSYKRSCSSSTCACCDFRACDCKYECPFNCECYRNYMHTINVINCNKKNLTQIPYVLSISTTQLDLSQNYLKRLNSYQFFAKAKLTNLNLSFNEINFIEENSFYSLTKLRFLYMNQNKLQILFGYEFKELKSLEYLDLSSNLIQFIALNTFSKLSNLKYLNLNMNYLKHIIEDKLYFKYNIYLNNYQINNQTISIDHYEHIDNQTTITTDKDTGSDMNTISSTVTDEPSLAYLYDIGMSTKLKFINNSNSDLEVFECANKMFDKILLKNLTNFLNMFQNNNNSDSNQNNIKNVINEFFQKLVVNIVKKCRNDKQDASVDYLKQEENYLILNKISFIFYIIITIIFTLLVSSLLILVVLNSKKHKMIQNVFKRFQMFKDECWTSRGTTHHHTLTPSTTITSSTASYMQSLNSNNYYYLYKNTAELNNEKNYKSKVKTYLEDKKLNYDLFLIYNKLDSDLVHNLIVPILKSKPYYYAVAMQHNLRFISSTDAGSDNDDCLLMSTHCLNYIDYIKASSYVVFIISKNLLTEFEYKLVCKTPKCKRIVIMVDNINETIVKQLIKPKKIIKWQFFNLNENLNEFNLKSFISNEKFNLVNNDAVNQI